MKKKRMKVKRYKRSFSGSADRQNTLRKVLMWIVAALVLFALGWLLAKPGLDLASKLWYQHKNGGTTPPSSSTSAPSEAQSGAVTAPSEITEPETPSAATAKGTWKFVALSSVATPEQAAQVAKQLAENGVSGAVLTLKDETGNLYYNSAVDAAKSAISPSAIDAAAVAKAFTEQGVTPIAAVWAFRDATMPYLDRATAVKYQGTDYNWLDNAKELGGKPWMNPNSAAAQTYLNELVKEISAMGYQKILVSGLQFPEGYSLQACDFGTLSGSKEQLLAKVGTDLQTAAGEAEVWFEFPQAAVSGESFASYGASPAGFGLANVLVRSTNVTTVNEAGETVNTLPDTAEETLEGLKAALEKGGTKQVGFYLAGISGNELSAANETAKAAGYEVQLIP